MNLQKLFGLYISILCLLPGAAFAQANLIHVSNADSAKVFLEQLDVDVKITGSIATTTWTMVFRNNAARQLEAQLTFPLAEGITVSRYAIDIKGKLREAVPVNKARATTVLEAIENQRVDPGILERIEGNAFRTRIYPLPAGGTRTVLIAYEQVLDQQEPGFMRYQLPLLFNAAIPVLNISATVYQSPSRPTLADDLTGITFDKRSSAWYAEKQLRNFRAAQPLSIRIPRDNSTGIALMQQKGNEYYCLLQAPPRNSERTRALPNKISIVWDASLSGMQRDHNAELKLLDVYLKRVSNATVSLTTFSNKVHATQSFRVANGNWQTLKKVLKAMIYDGGTQLGAVNFQKLPGQEILLFSDGVNTYGADEPHMPRVPAWCITSTLRSDYPWLRYFASRSGGGLIDLNTSSIADALQQLTSQPLQLLGLKRAGHIREVYPNLPIPASAGTTISFISSKSKAEVVLQYGYGRTVTAEQRVLLDAGRQAAPDAPLERIWAEEKIAALDLQYEQNKQLIEALGKRYGLVTRNTSLIVLETVEDYVRYRIDPPVELREEYNELVRERMEEHDDDRESKLEDIEDVAEDLRSWWAQDFRPKPRLKPAKATPPAIHVPVRPRVDGIGGISGTVKNARGEKIVGAYVRVYEHGRYLDKQHVTDIDGYFSLRPLPAGNYTLVITYLETRITRPDIAVNQDRVTLLQIELPVIEDSARRARERLARFNVGIKGAVKDEKNNPISNVRVEVSQGGTVVGKARTDFDGNYKINPLKGGRYDVKFSHRGNELIITDVSLPSDAIVVVNGRLSTAKHLQQRTRTVRKRPAPIVHMESPGSVSVKTAEQIERSATRNVTDIASLGTRAYRNSSGASVYGARSGNTNYVIDGVRMNPGASTVTTRSEMHVISGDFTYDTAMLGNLRQLKPGDQYRRYLQLRESKMMVPSFYFAVAGHFIATNRKDLGLRILSNLAELEMENYEIHKMLGYKLKELGEYKAEAAVFRKVLSWRPMDPQSLRDYGLALADAGHYQAALDTLYAALINEIDESLEEDFEGIEETLLPEINNLIARHKASLQIKAIPRKLIVPMPADIRVVINWNMKNTDIDLWVTDPNDEKCYYSNSTTAIGGRITDDFTGGFGPEQFMLRRAIPGKYKIEINYYGESLVKIAGPATVMAEVYTGWGTPQQKRQIIVLQMDADEKEGVYIGDFYFDRN